MKRGTFAPRSRQMHQADRLFGRSAARTGNPRYRDGKIGLGARDRAVRHFDGRLP
ncbi:hypothetical protein D3C72_2451720 [compost metagenome]